ncbi:MAG: pentapeptide repeat-containing protein [Nodosilinea sp. LVE1205-7]
MISANLKGALISKASLENVNLANADLQGATIRNSSLKGAVLYGADLKDANLENLNLNEIKNASKFKKDQLEKVASLCNVQLPDHIKINTKSSCTSRGK